ncbi:MAG TPA: DUF6262 family protein [Streptosporangiaceae bacterium]|jgi:hypothetical protein
MTTTNTAAMTDGRRSDTARRRQRVLKAVNDAAASGEEISVSGIARRAGVDRTFLYRHRDLLEQLHAAEAQPSPAPGTGPAVSRASLQADLLAAQQRASRLAARVHQLEHRLSEQLGQQAWRESGLGAPADIDALNQKIIHLEQHVTDLRLQLEERDQDLDAARAANRDMMTRINTPASTAPTRR